MEHKPANDNPDQTDRFCAALTILCRQHGIDIEGGVLCLMEPEDFSYSYRADDESKLFRA